MLYDLLNKSDWLYHYEVVVSRHGRDQIIARVPSRPRAQVAIVRTQRRLEVSHQTVHWRRVRGLHPRKAAELCFLFLIVAATLPWFWPRIVLVLMGTALIAGLLTSGKEWRQGGEDDR